MKMMEENPESIMVFGAGPAGLSAAWKLAESGKKVTVVEKYNLPGGLCRTLRHNDYIFDLGGHRFLTQDQEVLEEIVTLMGDRLVERSRTSVIRLKGKYFHYPLDAKNLVMNLNPFLSVKCFINYLYTRLARSVFPKPLDSFEDWVVSRFGRSLYNIYFGPYTTKLWGMSPTKLSADWSSQRISLINLWDVFLRLLWKKSDTPKTYAKRFFYPLGGIGEISEKMVERIKKAGSDVVYGECVKKLKGQDGKIDEITTVDKNGNVTTYSADFFISTIPLDELIVGIEPSCENNFLAAAERMTYRGVMFLFLTVDLPQVTPNTWMYIPEEDYFFFRIQEPRNWSESTVPSGKTSIILEIACSKDDEIWNMSDREIYEHCIISLKKLNLFDVTKIKDYFTARIGHAYPVYTLDYRDYLETGLSFLSQLKNVISIGREGLYRYNNMDHSIKMGFLASRYIHKQIGYEDILNIAVEQKSFESDQARLNEQDK